MLFPTVNFAIFFTVVLALSWLLRRRYVTWRLFMIGASFFFYGFWDPRFVALLAASVLANYAFGVAIYRSLTRTNVHPAPPAQLDFGAVPAPTSMQLVAGSAADVLDGPRPRRLRMLRAAVAPEFAYIDPGVRLVRSSWTPWLLAGGVGLNLVVLGWFKYYEFFTTSLVNTLADFGVDAPVPLLQIVLPIGISFFTFQAISYLVDISRGDIRPMRVLDFATYLSFFPHLVAGPIVRASEFAPQLQRPPNSNAIPATRAFWLITAGLFKKVVISSYLAREIVDPVFGVPGQHSGGEVLVASYAYAVQIFADFSGYTDIAIGCALLLGFQLPQNFNAPYSATSLQDFWRRWHMTLSRWLRDYLYIPLGGSRGNWLFTWRNLLIVMVLGGLWHGAAWTFIAWGAIHGCGLVVERAVPVPQRWTASRLHAVIRWLITFHVICLAWIFFRAESLGDAFEMLRLVFTDWGPAPIVTPLVAAVIAGSIAVQFVPARLPDRLQFSLSRLQPVGQAAAFACCIVVIEALGPRGVAPFIYFRF